MNKRKKILVRVKTEHGYEVKAWQNIRTGAVTPTNWKIDAGYLAGSMPNTKRRANRRKRKELARHKFFLHIEWLRLQQRQAAAAVAQ